jgi:thioredoxin reductase (NADPH)
MSVPAADDGGNDDRLDCLVIGAGPAGLTAATYFARFHRRFVVVDAGHSRARWIPTSHNCPGFPFGVAGPALLEKLREQATTYGAQIIQDRIVTLQRDGDGFIAIAASGARWCASHVLLATGIVDRMPPIAGIDDAIGAGVVRLCAVCDGYEANDERLAVYGPVEEAISHAVFLRTFSRSVTAIASDAAAPDAESLSLAQRARVEVLPMPSRLRHDAKRCVVEFDCAGTPADTHEFGTREFDTIYPVLGGVAQSALATAMGAHVDDNGELIVDRQQQTSVDGLYASGDIVSALNQISVAVGHAAIAATAIHNRLPHNFREDPL